MKNKKRLYAKILLNECLKIEKDQPLLIKGVHENYEMISLIYEEALLLGIKDIYLDITEPHITKSLYENINKELLEDHIYFNKKIYNDYAKKNAAFLMLSSETPGLMDDVDSSIIADMRNYSSKTCKEYNDMRDRNELAWCIAVVPTQKWSEKIFPNNENSLNLLWEKIFEINYINEKNPEEKISNNIHNKLILCNKLNDLNLKKLSITNSIGTNVEIELLEQGIWCSGLTKLQNGKEVLVNYPSFEIFTSPNKYKVNGKIVASIPLLVADALVEGLEVIIKDGKICDVKSKTSEEIIKKIIYNEKGANYLGEIALVEHNSPIRNTDLLYYTTLLDENASCHFAFGAGFSECIKNGKYLTEAEKEENGLNVSNTHVDVMFGTKDLLIIGTTKNNEEIEIFQNGNFSNKIKNNY